jgi:hypothetical protein
MRNAVFTIVAKNYIGLAQVLEKSIQRNADADFFIFVADEFDDNKIELPPNVIICKTSLAIEASQWTEMSFKYNLVEFCTAIKPYCFNFLFDQKNYEKVIYLDPDVYVFNSLNPIFFDLDKFSIVLTPHIVDMQTPFKGAYHDYLFLVNGTFNLGFIGLKNSVDALRMIAWWKDRLNDQCFFDNDRGMATDQKWINLLPAFFDSSVLKISFDKGLNVAPWNYHERKILVQDNKLFVTKRNYESDDLTPLTFVHFSGYDYKAFANKNISHKNENADAYPDLNYFFDQYAKALSDDCFQKFINLTYSYNKYKNGKNIISLHRRICRRLLNEGYHFSNPFETDEESFYEGLSKRRLIDHSTSSADVITNKTVPGFNKKIKWVNWLFRTLQSVLGVRRYSIFIRFFRRYFKEENQAFLFDKNMRGKLW